MRRSYGSLLVLVPALVAAVAVAAAALAGFGGDAAFIRDQQHPRPVLAAELDQVMLTTPEPYGRHARNAVRARCRALGEGELRNPWRCRMEYRSGRRARLRVTLRPDGSFRADHLGGSGEIVGCCVSGSRESTP